MSEDGLTSDEFSRALIGAIKTLSRGSLIIDGKIKSGSVDLSKYICSVIVSGIEISNVILKVIKNGQASFIEIPADDSVCLITFRDNNIQRPQLLFCDKCVKIVTQIGVSKQEVNDNNIIFTNSNDGGIKFNDGVNEGLVKVIELTQELNNRTTRINKIVFALQALSAAAAAIGGTPVTGTTLAGFINAAIASIINPLSPTVKDNIEDKKVIH